MDMEKTLRQLQRENLNRLANHLWELPRNSHNFDMQVFACRLDGSLCEGFGDPATPASMHTYSREEPCNTVACAAGHLPAVPEVPAPRCGEVWEEYIARVTGLLAAPKGPETVKIFHEYLWCFGACWIHFDNTPHGAAQRVWWLLRHGLPRGWSRQCYGYEPLCYTKLQPSDTPLPLLEENV